MHEVISDSILDTLKLAPFIVAVYLVIEIAERKFADRFATGKVLFSPVAPLVGAAAGIVPQCGFSVVSANLYSAGKITLGTLVAVFIATSDEAIPVILADYTAAPKLIPLILIKFAFAVAVGYFLHFTFKNGFKIRGKVKNTTHQSDAAKLNLNAGKEKDCKSDEKLNPQCGCALSRNSAVLPCEEKRDILNRENASDKSQTDNRKEENVTDSNKEREEDGEKNMPDSDKKDTGDVLHCHGCHGHSVTGGKEGVGTLILHPLIHSLTVLAFIFIVNLALGTIIFYVGEDALSAFLNRTAFLQPFFAALVGLIPNCAASVVISRLYALGSLSLGAAVAGLSAGAGLGYAVLFKENKNVKENLLIVLFVFAVCVLFGMAVDAINALIVS